MRLSPYPKLIDPDLLVENFNEAEPAQKSSNKGFLYLIALALTIVTILFVYIVGNLDEVVVDSVSKFLETIPFMDLRLSKDLVKQLKFPGPITNTIFASNICFLSFAAFDLLRKRETKAQSSLFKESSAVSYSIHLAILLIILLSLFLNYKPKPKIQVTKIEFIPTQTPAKTPPKKTVRKSTQQSIDAGKHDPQKKITPAAKPPGAPGAPAKPVAPAKPKPSPKPVTPPVVETPPTPTPVKPPTPKPMLPKPKALRDAIEPLPNVDPKAKTLPQLLNYTPNSTNSSSSNSSSSPAPKSSGQSSSSSDRSSDIVSRLSNIPRAPDSMGGSGAGGAYGTPGNPPPNAYPDRAPSVAANASANFGPYMSALQRKIKMSWKPPRGTESNRIMVTFSVLQNGRLENLQMIIASQDASANQAALEAVTNAAPFAPLPAGAGPKVEVEFTFDYNVFQKTRF